MESDEYDYSLFSQIYDYLSGYGVNVTGDLKRLSSWGVAKDEDGDEALVLIDAGLTDDVFFNYYAVN